jgi:hypothetical protein
MGNRVLAVLFLWLALALSGLNAGATGTAHIQWNTGAVQIFHNVKIQIVHMTLQVTSSDGTRTYIITHAACAYDGYYERCRPLSAKVEHNGTTAPSEIAAGTLYINPTNEPRQLSHSSTQIPPHGVLAAIKTKRGNYLSLSGTIDSISR